MVRVKEGKAKGQEFEGRGSRREGSRKGKSSKGLD